MAVVRWILLFVSGVGAVHTGAECAASIHKAASLKGWLLASVYALAMLLCGVVWFLCVCYE